jgi:hypothetical protein
MVECDIAVSCPWLVEEINDLRASDHATAYARVNERYCHLAEEAERIAATSLVLRLCNFFTL